MMKRMVLRQLGRRHRRDGARRAWRRSSRPSSGRSCSRRTCRRPAARPSRPAPSSRPARRRAGTRIRARRSRTSRQGPFVLEVDGQPTRTLKTGDVFLVPAGVIHNGKTGTADREGDRQLRRREGQARDVAGARQIARRTPAEYSGTKAPSCRASSPPSLQPASPVGPCTHGQPPPPQASPVSGISSTVRAFSARQASKRCKVRQLRLEVGMLSSTVLRPRRRAHSSLHPAHRAERRGSRQGEGHHPGDSVRLGPELLQAAGRPLHGRRDRRRHQLEGPRVRLRTAAARRGCSSSIRTARSSRSSASAATASRSRTRCASTRTTTSGPSTRARTSSRSSAPTASC